MSKKRGLIFSFEGTDKSGKGTQTSKLYERFSMEDIPCEMMSFPRYTTPTGRIVGGAYLGKNYLSTEGSWFEDPAKLNPRIASLYYAADRLAAAADIEMIVDSGKHLILDRYVESNMAHQGGKLSGDERWDFIKWINRLEYDLLQLPRPDMFFFLHMPTEVSIELGKNMDEFPDAHESDSGHLRSAEKMYLGMAKKFGWTTIDCAPDKTMESLKSKEEIHEEVYGHVSKFMERI